MGRIDRFGQSRALPPALLAHAGGFAVAAMATSVMAMLTVTGLCALRVPRQYAAALGRR